MVALIEPIQYSPEEGETSNATLFFPEPDPEHNVEPSIVNGEDSPEVDEVADATNVRPFELESVPPPEVPVDEAVKPEAEEARGVLPVDSVGTEASMASKSSKVKSEEDMVNK